MAANDQTKHTVGVIDIHKTDNTEGSRSLTNPNKKKNEKWRENAVFFGIYKVSRLVLCVTSVTFRHKATKETWICIIQRRTNLLYAIVSEILKHDTRHIFSFFFFGRGFLVRFVLNRNYYEFPVAFTMNNTRMHVLHLKNDRYRRFSLTPFGSFYGTSVKLD